MRMRSYPCSSRARHDRLSQTAFALPEIMVAIGLLVILLGVTVATQLIGMRMLEKTDAKGSASTEARRNISRLLAEVCSAKNVLVGNGSETSFSEAGKDVPQQGVALQIYPSTDTNIFIRYFLNTVAKTLNRATNGGAASIVVASGIKNPILFTAENFAGNILTNTQNNSLIGVSLQFYQLQTAGLPVGPTNFYTSYQIQSKIAQRAF